MREKTQRQEICRAAEDGQWSEKFNEQIKSDEHGRNGHECEGTVHAETCLKEACRRVGGKVQTSISGKLLSSLVNLYGSADEDSEQRQLHCQTLHGNLSLLSGLARGCLREAGEGSGSESKVNELEGCVANALVASYLLRGITAAITWTSHPPSESNLTCVVKLLYHLIATCGRMDAPEMIECTLMGYFCLASLLQRSNLFPTSSSNNELIDEQENSTSFMNRPKVSFSAVGRRRRRKRLVGLSPASTAETDNPVPKALKDLMPTPRLVTETYPCLGHADRIQTFVDTRQLCKLVLGAIYDLSSRMLKHFVLSTTGPLTMTPLLRPFLPSLGNETSQPPTIDRLEACCQIMFFNAIPWILLLYEFASNACGDEKERAKAQSDAAYFRQYCYELLWNAAFQLEQQSRTGHDLILLLRQWAIYLYCLKNPFANTATNTHASLLDETTAKNVCTWAYKAAGSYQHYVISQDTWKECFILSHGGNLTRSKVEKSNNMSPLLEFHNSISSLLDIMVKRQQEPVYLEYCVLREMSRSFAPEYRSANTVIHEPTFLFFVLDAIRLYLSVLDSGDTEEDTFPLESFYEKLQNERHTFKGSPLEFRTYLFKTWKVVQNIPWSASAESLLAAFRQQNEQSHSIICKAAVLARLLHHFLRPLSLSVASPDLKLESLTHRQLLKYALSSSQKSFHSTPRNKQQISSFYQFMESLRHSSILYNYCALAQSPPSDSMFQDSDQTLLEAFYALSICETLEERNTWLEMLARTFASNAKFRLENQHEKTAITPLILSCHLFSLLPLKDHPRCQLSIRYSYLASILSSSESRHHEASLVAHALSLRTSIQFESPLLDGEGMMLGLDPYALATLLLAGAKPVTISYMLPEQAFISIERMVKLAINSFGQEIEVIPSEAIRLSELGRAALAVQLMMNDSCAIKHIGKIIIQVFDKLSDAFSTILIHVLAEAIRTTARYVSRAPESDKKWSIFKMLVDSSLIYCQQINAQPLYRAFILSVASNGFRNDNTTSSSKEKEDLSDDRRNQACLWTKEALEILLFQEKYSGDLDEIFYIVSTAAFQVLLSNEDTGKTIKEKELQLESILNNCCKATEILVTSHNKTVDDVSIIQSLCRMSSFLHKRFTELGAFLLAAKCAALVAHLDDRLSRSAYTAAGSEMMEGGFHDMAYYYLFWDHPEKSELGDSNQIDSAWKTFETINKDAHRMALLARCSSRIENITAMQKDLEYMISTLDSLVNKEPHDRLIANTKEEESILLLGFFTDWTVTTCLLALVELSQKRYDMHRKDSLRYLMKCVEICKINKSLALRHESIKIHRISEDTLLSFDQTSSGRWAGRLAYTLTEVARCHSQLGDRRKVEVFLVFARKALELNQAIETDSDMSCRQRDLLISCNEVSHLAHSSWSQNEGLCSSFEYMESESKCPCSAESLFYEPVDSAIHWRLNFVKMLIAEADYLRRFDENTCFNRAHSLYQKALETLSSLCSQSKLCALQSCKNPMLGDDNQPDPPFDRRFVYLYNKLHLCLAAFVTGDEEASKKRISTYEEILQSHYSTQDEKANCSYLLGREALEKARYDGSLFDLWQGNSTNKQDDYITFVLGQVDEELPLQLARRYFQDVLELLPRDCKMSRDALRCLALALGPDDFISSSDCLQQIPKATILLNRSIGATSRMHINQAYDKFVSEETSLQQELFNALDAPIQQIYNSAEFIISQMAIHLPPEWKAITASICPTGDFLAASIYKDEDGVIKSNVRCIFRSTERSFKANVLRELDSILERNRNQLAHMDPRLAESFGTREARKLWWKERERVDCDLRELLDRTQAEFFDTGHWDDFFLMQTDSTVPPFSDDIASPRFQEEISLSDDSSDCSIGITNLASKFDAVFHIESPPKVCKENTSMISAIIQKKKSEEDLMSLTVAKLKEELLARFNIQKSAFRTLRKSDLVRLYLVKQDETTILDNEIERGTSNNARFEPVSDEAGLYNSNSSSRLCDENVQNASTQNIHRDKLQNNRACSILILDEHLHRFPWENLPMLRGHCVCRLQSLPFVISPLMSETEKYELTIDPSKVSYVLDPESNLDSTRTRINDAICAILEGSDLCWSGTVGEAPKASSLHEVLTTEHSMFLYCGHGGGESFFSRSQVESLLTGNKYSPEINNEQEILDSTTSDARRCRSTIILMGCSSGRLSSGTGPEERVSTSPLYYEADGIALSYILAGSPCVVANLWDVTDRDIDRFCIQLLQFAFSRQGDNEIEKTQNSNTVSEDTHVFDSDAQPGEDSLAHHVARARDACKLRFIVGSAPVCYGVPVRIK